MAAIDSSDDMSRDDFERAAWAPGAPAANRSESPGRNGVTTRPVSQNTIAQRIP